MPDLDSAKKKEHNRQRTENKIQKQKTTRKHWAQSDSNKEYGKYKSNTVELKLIDVSFLDLFGVLKSMILALLDVPPPLLIQFAMKFKRSTITGGTPSSFWHIHSFGVAIFWDNSFDFLAHWFYHDIFLDMWHGMCIGFLVVRIFSRSQVDFFFTILRALMWYSCQILKIWGHISPPCCIRFGRFLGT